MTPSAPELLASCAAALAAQPQPEDAGLFVAARLRIVATINALVAQESAIGTQVRVSENATLRAFLVELGRKYGAQFGDASDIDDGDFSLAALDKANDELRRLLICLHEAAEAVADRTLDRKILKLYREMARSRELQLPPSKPVA